MLFLSVLWEKYNTINAAFQAEDPRISHYFFLRSPFNVVWVCIAYWIFVRKIGPKLMEPLRPFELKNTLLIYNFIQVLVNGYLTIMGVRVLLFHHAFKDWTCMVADKSSADMLDVETCYIYCLIKVLDLMDTVFMVLRKSYRQITFLHVYHHISMALICPLALPFFGGGHFVPFGVMNSFVHVVMYSYYFLSAVSPTVKKALWWKKYLTQLQILQFLLIFIHLMIGFLNRSCTFSKTALILGVVQNVTMFILFSKFYINTYIKKGKCKIKSQDQKTS